MQLFHISGASALTPAQEHVRDSLNSRIRAGSLEFQNVPCLCGSGDFEQLAERERYGIEQPTVICRGCGLIQSNPRMTSEAYRDFYSSDDYRLLYDGEHFRDDWQARFTSASGRRIHQVVWPHLQPRSVVEIGAGGGWNLVAFKEAGAQVAGWDYSPQLTELGRAHGIAMFRGSIDEAVAAGVQYDLIILNHVLEHFLDPVDSLRKLHRLLTPAGRLYIGVPAIEFPFLALLQNAHTYYFTEQTLRHYAAKAGWKIGEVAREDRMRMDCVAAPGEIEAVPLDNEYRDAMTRLRANRWKVVALQAWYRARLAAGLARRRFARSGSAAAQVGKA